MGKKEKVVTMEEMEATGKKAGCSGEDAGDAGKERVCEEPKAEKQTEKELKEQDLIRRFGQWLLMWLFLVPLLAAAQPKALFRAVSVSGCNPFRADFLNLSTGASRSEWRFGNGNGSSLEHPRAVYNVPGRYSVTLVVYDSSGRRDSVTLINYITVFRNPQALFSLQSAQACKGDTVRLKDRTVRGDAGISGWEWDMGDGTTLNGPGPEHIYSSAGSYAISLAVTDSNGCRSGYRTSGAVSILGLPGVTVESKGNYRCQAPAKVHFEAACTGNGPFNVQWGYGDGATGSGQKSEHLYEQNGTFQIWCMVADANGCRIKKEIPGLVKIQEPRIRLSAVSPVICAGEEARFEASPEPQDGTGSYFWRFDDGDSAKSAIVRKTFHFPGEFGASLRYSWDGCITTVTGSSLITVRGIPDGRILPHDTAVCRRNRAEMIFSIAGSGFDSLIWLSDTGRLEMKIRNGKLHYPMDTSNGLYTIRARIISSAGCGEKELATTYRLRGPVPRLAFTNKGGCLPVNSRVEYTGTGDAPVVEYKWTVPDLGVSSSGRDIKVLNNRFGVSPLFLTVRDQNGCTAQISDGLMAGKRFGLDFEIPRKSVCIGEPLKIYNKSPYKGIDSVAFLYSWFNYDTLRSGNRDSFYAVVRDLPGKKYRFSFTVNSFGCTNRITPDKGPEVTLLGPLVQAAAEPVCETDSVIGLNHSLDYTSTYWKYRDEKGNLVNDPKLRLGTELGSKTVMEVVAENSINRCKDSMVIPLNVDPQVAAFTHDYNCRTGELSAVSTYKSRFHDSLYQWELLNLADSSASRYTGRRIRTRVENSGNYQLTLRIRNTKFHCTRPQRIYLGRPDMARTKAFSVTADRSSCFPVNFTLRDPWYSQWKGGCWIIGDSIRIPDTAETTNFRYTQQTGRIRIMLQRSDLSGCDLSDTVYFDVRQLQAKIIADQDFSDCRRTRATFHAFVDRSSGEDSLRFNWDFGHRQSTLQRDTVYQRNSPVHVKLSVQDKTGCYSRDSLNITLYAGRPKAYFYTPDSLNVCPPLRVSFVDSSKTDVGSLVSWKWDFGDGSGSLLRNPAKIYLTPGRYPVSLEVTNTTGCRDTLVLPDLVWVKGPLGSLGFDRISGCEPFNTSYKTNLQGQVTRIDVDMGDGHMLGGKQSAHIYRKPGRYMPRMILTDSAGCRYSPPVKDTIIVHPTPRIELASARLCRGQQLSIRPAVQSLDPVKPISWQVDGGKIFEADTITLAADVSRTFQVKVQAVTGSACADTALAMFRVYGTDAGLDIEKKEACLGEPLTLTEQLRSDTTIVSRKLWIGDREVSAVFPVVWKPSQRGILPMRYILTDALGCRTELENVDFVRIGDTLNPPVQRIYYSSVVDDFSTETRFAISREPDFKRQVLYVWKNGAWQGADSTESMEDTLFRISGLNTLRNSYCHRVVQQNFCGRRSDPVKLIPHCTVELQARADTNASVLNWTPYSGWSKVSLYRIWRKEHGSPEPFIQVDSVPGSSLRYTDRSVYCHRVYDYRIQALEEGGYRQTSLSDTSSCAPVHHLPLPAPEIWRTTVENNEHVRTEFDLFERHPYPVLTFELMREDGETRVVSADCHGLDALDDIGTRVQDRYYTYRVRGTDVCGTTSAFSNPGRSILLRVKDDSALSAVLTWNSYNRWNEGVQQYMVERRAAGGAFSVIGYTDSATTGYTDRDIPSSCASDIEYRVTALRRQPDAPDSSYDVVSQSNYAGFVPEIRFFTPNAFTPDANRLNETFHPKGVFYRDYELAVYNRWGEKLYQESGCSPAWDGNYMGQPAPEGVYAWRITAHDYAGKPYEFSGVVHLLR